MNAFASQVQATKERMRGLVFRGELPEGTVVREDDLRRELGESVRVVRQALRELAREGFLIRKPRVGTVVGGAASAGRLLPRMRSVGILTGYRESALKTDLFMARVAYGIEKSLLAPRQVTIFAQTSASTGGVDDPPRLEPDEAKRRVQGVIALEANHTPSLNQLVAAGLPVVAVDYYDPAGAFDVSAVDHQGAGYAAAAHLLRLGHRRIAFAGEGPRAGSSDPTWQDRLLGYLRAMAESGHLHAQPLVFDIRFRTHRHIPAELPDWHRAHTPSAYVLCSSRSAPFVLEALGALGLRCPHDISLACADGTLVEAPGRLRLSRLRVDYEDLGEYAVRLLNARLACKDAPPVRAILPVDFEVGDSSRAI